jgi:hypothetical protein
MRRYLLCEHAELIRVSQLNSSVRRSTRRASAGVRRGRMMGERIISIRPPPLFFLWLLLLLHFLLNPMLSFFSFLFFLFLLFFLFVCVCVCVCAVHQRSVVTEPSSRRRGRASANVWDEDTASREDLDEHRPPPSPRLATPDIDEVIATDDNTIREEDPEQAATESEPSSENGPAPPFVRSVASGIKSIFFHTLWMIGKSE